MNTYKTYDPEGNAITFNSLAEIKAAMDLTNEDIKIIFRPGIHTISTGDQVWTIAN